MSLAFVCALIAPSSANAAGDLTIEPDAVDFGEVPSGLSSGRSVTLTNAGPDPVEIGDIGLDGDADPFSFADGGCLDEVELAGGESCSLILTFEAPMVTADYEALLVVESPDTDAATASLTASSFLEGYLAADLSEFRVDPTPIGSTSGPYPLRVRNPGDSPVTISAVKVYGPPSIVPFAVAATGCVGTLPPREQCVVDLAFTPNARLGVGLQNAPLFVTQPGGVGLLLVLNGEALPPPSPSPPPVADAPKPRVSPASLRRLTHGLATLLRGGPARRLSLPSFAAPAAGRLSLTVFGWKGARRLRIGAGTQRFDGPTARRLRFRLTEKGVALLRRPERTRVKAVLRFEPDAAVGSRHAVLFRVKQPARRVTVVPR